MLIDLRIVKMIEKLVWNAVIHVAVVYSYILIKQSIKPQIQKMH